MTIIWFNSCIVITGKVLFDLTRIIKPLMMRMKKTIQMQVHTVILRSGRHQSKLITSPLSGTISKQLSLCRVSLVTLCSGYIITVRNIMFYACSETLILQSLDSAISNIASITTCCIKVFVFQYNEDIVLIYYE